MIVIPHTRVTDVPTGQNTLVDIESTMDFIEVAAACVLNPVRGIRKSYYTGLSAFMFDANVKFGFHKNYSIESIEFRSPFNISDVDGLFFEDVNLFLPTLSEVKSALELKGVSIRLIDVGLEAPELGLSFYSDNYENDLAVSLDAITVHFHAE